MRRIYLLFSLLSIALVAGAQSRDGTCDPIDSLLVQADVETTLVYWNINDTALAYNYRYRLIGDTVWTPSATLDSFIFIDMPIECAQYEVSISTVCPFDTSAFTLDTIQAFCPNATRNLLDDVDALSIFPVPFSDRLTVSSVDPTLYIEQLVVRAISGQRVDMQQNLRGESIHSLTIEWSSGVYLLEIKTNQGWHFQKVLKL